jgi:hypothetical protein
VGDVPPHKLPDGHLVVAAPEHARPQRGIDLRGTPYVDFFLHPPPGVAGVVPALSFASPGRTRPVDPPAGRGTAASPSGSPAPAKQGDRAAAGGAPETLLAALVELAVRAHRAPGGHGATDGLPGAARGRRSSCSGASPPSASSAPSSGAGDECVGRDGSVAVVPN